MSEGYSTESESVAATFISLELTKLVIDRVTRGDLTQELKDIDAIFKSVYASVRSAQSAG